VVAQQLGYPYLALKEGNPYLVQIWFPAGMTWCHGLPTLDEAIEFILGCENAALFAVDEPISGLAVQRKLADVAFGGWYPIKGQKELTMAKVKEVEKGRKKRDVVEDLIGDSKPKKVKASKANGKAEKASKKTKPTPPTREPAFADTQTIKVLKKYDGTPRDGSLMALSMKVLSSGITVGAWQKARRKAGVENPGFGVLRKLVNDGYVRVK